LFGVSEVIRRDETAINESQMVKSEYV